MGSFTQPRIKSFNQGTSCVGNQFKFVKFGASDEVVVPCSAADEKTIGVQMNAPGGIDEQIEVALPGGGAKLIASAGITRGAYLAATAAGLAKTSAPGAGLHSHVGAIAHESGVLNDVIEVDVVAFDLIG